MPACHEGTGTLAPRGPIRTALCTPQAQHLQSALQVHVTALRGRAVTCVLGGPGKKADFTFGIF